MRIGCQAVWPAFSFPPGAMRRRRWCNLDRVKTLILGGARSGKSALAERLAAGCALPVTVVATARMPADPDDEMARRIAHHRARRPAAWSTVEEPLQVAAALAEHARPETCVVVECLTLWLGNVLLERPADARREIENLTAQVAQLPGAPGELLLVSNEVGLGIMPDNALARRFADLSGRLHQALAARCERVLWCVAGLPQALKGDLDAGLA